MTRNTELPLPPPPPPTSSSLITVSTCTLNQWAMDFAGNVDRIEQSCKLAKEQNACYRLGPELEICGYGCEDHFYENDTFSHCWEALYELIHVRGCTDDGLLCDFGMPVLFGGVRYNCRVLCRDRRILYVRPKACLADNGNYREGRWFTAYTMDDDDNGSNNWRNQLLLPTEFHAFQKRVPFGNPRTGRLEFLDGTTVGVECCEELWTAHATHISLSLLGVDIIGNGSGSHHELRKLQQRLDLILNATKKCGGLYLYANQRGCDGGRCYYDGSALIACNGKVLALADQFGLDDVQVVSATVDLNEVRSYRASSSSFGRQAQASMHGPHSPSIQVNDYICHRDVSDRNIMHTIERPLTIHVPEEECCLGPACWLWDFLRRSGASGFFLPLSGGADSSAVAAIVHTMTSMVFAKVRADPSCQTAKDLKRILNVADDDKTDYMPQSSQEIARNIFFTCYMGTSNSSINTESRSRRLAAAIGSYHLSIKIDIIVEALLKVFRLATGGKVPKYESQGGTRTQDLALQNIQARIRMVSAYLFAQLLPWIRGKSKGFLLVLGSANVDEALRGYFTKYDASSADLNPIGAINKGDLKRMLLFCSQKYDVPVLNEGETLIL